MGLILGPLFIFWLLMSAYAFKIGYSLLIASDLLSYKVIVVGGARLAMALYVYLGLQSFKSQQELWTFAIPFFFMANKMSFAVLLLGLLAHWFGQSYLTQPYLKALPFLIIFTVTSGALVGAFYADSFMTKNNIRQTY